MPSLSYPHIHRIRDMCHILWHIHQIQKFCMRAKVTVRHIHPHPPTSTHIHVPHPPTSKTLRKVIPYSVDVGGCGTWMWVDVCATSTHIHVPHPPTSTHIHPHPCATSTHIHRIRDDLSEGSSPRLEVK